MALKAELTGDEQRGPGFGLLRLAPLSAQGTVSLLIQRNQEKLPYLAGNGEWSNQEFWHEVPVGFAEPPAVVLALGPALVDPIATQPGRVAFQLTVQAGEVRDVGRLVNRNLLASAAAGERPDDEAGHGLHKVDPPPPPPPPPPEQERTIVSPEDRPLVTQGSEDPGAGSSGKGRLIAILVAALAVLGLGGAWFGGLLSPKEAAKPEPVKQAQPAAASAAPSVATLPELNAYIQTGPAPDAAHGVAETLMAAGKPDLAMLAYQYAARQGSVPATVALAHMYDPDSWSKDKSPLPAADAETAAYWYEPAAQAGNIEAQRQLGKILLSLNPTGFQHDKGLEWLNKAAAGGDEAAKTLLQGK